MHSNSIKSHLKGNRRPTQRAPDVWDSAAFSSIFMALGFPCSQAESTPSHTQVTQADAQRVNGMREATSTAHHARPRMTHDF